MKEAVIGALYKSQGIVTKAYSLPWPAPPPRAQARSQWLLFLTHLHGHRAPRLHRGAQQRAVRLGHARHRLEQRGACRAA